MFKSHYDKCSWNIFDLIMVVKLLAFNPNCDSNLTVEAWTSFFFFSKGIKSIHTFA